jgi:hypothetical protein
MVEKNCIVKTAYFGLNRKVGRLALISYIFLSS